jgi:hypothetical protein
MARGPKKHLKRLSAPHHWMLDKIAGKYVCVPLALLAAARLAHAVCVFGSLCDAWRCAMQCDGANSFLCVYC